jgi:chromosome segregation ATPase
MIVNCSLNRSNKNLCLGDISAYNFEINSDSVPVDIDDFDFINDSLSSIAVDEVLQKKYNALQKQYDDLSSSYNGLQSKLKILELGQKDSKSRYSALEKNLKSELENVDKFKKELANLREELTKTSELKCRERVE